MKNTLNRVKKWSITASLVALVCLGLDVEAAAQTIGGFDVARGGDFSIASGFERAALRDDILAAFPAVSFTENAVLDTAYLDTLDVVILGSAATQSTGITPLSVAEQTALTQFVQDGGTAILITDNDALPDVVAANQSIASPFGLMTSGTLTGTQPATVTSPNHFVAEGVFGVVAGYDTVFPGWYSSTGVASVLATVNTPMGSRATLAVMDPNVFAQGSGTVLFLSDHVFSNALILNALPFPIDPAAMLIGGIDATRGGIFSLVSGSQHATLRADIRIGFPQALFTGSPVLASAYLDTLDVVFISSASSQSTGITPLSVAEQTALTQFVQDGGTAILVTDDNTFPDIVIANQSVAGPFGLTTGGALPDTQPATVVGPVHFVTEGPFGVVTTYDTAFPGWFTSTGTATVLATLDNSIGPEATLAVMDEGVFAQGSGLVVFLSDNVFAGELILNAIAGPVGPGAGTVPDGGNVPGSVLTIWKNGAQLDLDWGPSCRSTDLDYIVYEGTLGAFTSHSPLLSCGTGGLTSATIPTPAGSSYYLVVPTDGLVEGSYGTQSDASPRPTSTSACFPQLVGSCF